MNFLKIKKILCAVVALSFSAWAIADTYVYDPLNRLTSVTYSNGGSQTYGYDAAGNLTSLVSTPPTPSNFTLTVNKAGPGTGAVAGSGITCGATCTASVLSGSTVTLTATPDAGSAFGSWTGFAGCASTNPCTFTMPAAPVTVTAAFTSTPLYQVTVNKNGSGHGTVTSTPAGINCGSNCISQFTSGSSVTLIAAATAGSAFTGWAGDCTGTSNCVLGMAAAKNVTANFVLNAPHGTCNPCTLSFAAQNVGTTSAAKTVTLSNTGNAVLNITSIVSNNSMFAFNHNCGASLAAGASCSMNVTFSPTTAGTTTSSIVLTDNSANSPHTLPVSGVGVPAGAPICTLVANPSRVSRAGSSTLTASCTNTPTSYSWTGGTCAGNTTANCSVTPVLTTTYAVTGTNGSGSNTASATVTVVTGDITPILFLLLFD